MNDANIVGLDLSLAATGVSICDGRLYTIKPKKVGDRRLAEIAGTLQGFLLPMLGDPIVVMEDVPFGLRNAAAGALGMLHGAVRLALISDGVPYITVPPATLKTYATGRGNAQKADLRMELYRRTEVDIRDDNQVDAAWLRLLGLDLLGRPEIELPKVHRRALDKLVIPQEVLAR